MADVAPLLRLPDELLRQIIQHLVHVSPSPSNQSIVTFYKAQLLPFASTSKRLRAASTEFLFGSVDLFEASFGLSHRVLASDVILQKFRDLIKGKDGVHGVYSFVRVGVRRVLIRDRDGKAFKEPAGLEWLGEISESLENLRSIHFDGIFHSSNSNSGSKKLVPGERLRETLVNLTFINVHPLSPIFQALLTPRPSLFLNLTRIEYWDKASKDRDGQPPPMQHLSILVFRLRQQRLDRFQPLLRFLRLHRASLQRISLSYSSPLSEGAYYTTDGYNPNYVYGPHISHSMPGAVDASRTVRYPGEWDEDHAECMRALWDTLEKLDKIRLLEFNTPITMTLYAPERKLQMRSLKGVILQSDTPRWDLVKPYDDVDHPIVTFYNRLPCAHLAFSHTSQTRWGQSRYSEAGLPTRTRSALEWLQQAKDILHRGVKTFSHFDVSEGDTVYRLLEGQPREVMILENATERDMITGIVGGWKFGEEAERDSNFVEEERL